MKKERWINIALWGGLAILVLAVIITSIILHFKNKQLDDLKDKNQAVQPEKGEQTQESKIFLKNFVIFIDKDLKF